MWPFRRFFRKLLKRSRQWTRSGPLISPTSRCRKDSSCWWRSWGCCSGPCTPAEKASPTCATSQMFFMSTDATTSRMGVWPPGAGLQGQAPNHPMLLWLRAAVVSDGEKAASSRQVSDGKMSNSESPLTHRKVFQMLSKRVQVGGTRISVDVTCLRSTRQPVFRRHEPITGLDVERGNLSWGVKGKPQVATTTRANTKTHARGGSARSSDEGAVMALEQRGCVIPSGSTQQLPLAGGRR